MRVVVDIETNSLIKPTNIWCIVCKDIDSGQTSIFRNVTDATERERFLKYAEQVTLWIGHNWLSYDYPILSDLTGLRLDDVCAISCDTLIISKLVDYSRDGGHSIESYGETFGYPKGIPVENNELLPSKFFPISFFSKYSKDLENYCVRDVEICHKIYDRYKRIIDDPNWRSSIDLEHRFQLICNDLHNNGFNFNSSKASSLLEKITKELEVLDAEILRAFPPRTIIIRKFMPKATKFGTISKTSVPRTLHTRIHEFEIGKTYDHTSEVAFNPSSHKQIIQVLNEAGWKPEEKTKTHIEAERELHRLKYSRGDVNPLDIDTITRKLVVLKNSGWRINEHNLGTLPAGAPAPAKTLAKRILLEARRRTLTEWLNLVGHDGRIHGKFYGLGAWTHRMAHQSPNTANIPREFKEDGSVKLLGKEMRELWCAPKKRLLVGVDAEGIQLRIFAHYIDDAEFTKALVEGKKDDKTDPHSLNQRILGDVCKSRQAAKRFVYALLLGGGISKLAQILETSTDEAKSALARLMERYQGFTHIKKHVIPADGKRGWFRGIDGRSVRIPGDTAAERGHLCMSGYLQNGEAIIIKRAAVTVDRALAQFRKENKWMFVNIVHDELQSETNNNMEVALHVAQTKADAIKEAGEYYKLKCPMAGSYWAEDRKKNTIGCTWWQTH